MAPQQSGILFVVEFTKDLAEQAGFDLELVQGVPARELGWLVRNLQETKPKASQRDPVVIGRGRVNLFRALAGWAEQGTGARLRFANPCKGDRSCSEL